MIIHSVQNVCKVLISRETKTSWLHLVPFSVNLSIAQTDAKNSVFVCVCVNFLLQHKVNALV